MGTLFFDQILEIRDSIIFINFDPDRAGTRRVLGPDKDISLNSSSGMAGWDGVKKFRMALGTRRKVSWRLSIINIYKK